MPPSPWLFDMNSDWFFGSADNWFMDSDFPIDEDMEHEIDFTTWCDQNDDLYGNDIEIVECCLMCGVVPHGCVC